MLFVMMAFAGVFSSARAQDPVPDLGQQDLLALACDFSIDRASLEHIPVHACRRAAPDQIDAYKATMTVKIFTVGYGNFLITISFYKSPWWVGSFSPTKV